MEEYKLQVFESTLLREMLFVRELKEGGMENITWWRLIWFLQVT